MVAEPNAPHNFYQHTEKELYDMTYAHYWGLYESLSEFSSWSASLHVVLNYCSSMMVDGYDNIHVAVLYTRDLENDVLVWHVPQQLNLSAIEYLAHGTIRGRGYKAVPLTKIQALGLMDVFPEIHDSNYVFGCEVLQYSLAM